MSTNVTSGSLAPVGTQSGSGATLPAMPTFRIVEFRYDVLSNSNYVRWARRMRDHLVLCGLGKVLSQVMPADSQYNLIALSVIRSNVDDDELTAIEDYECAHETWRALHASHAATCNARRMHIRGQLAALRLTEGESIREYGRRAIDIRRSLLDVGATCGEEEIVDYILLGLPSSYHTIRTIVGDSAETNLEEVLRRLSRYQEQELNAASEEPGVALSGQEWDRSKQGASKQQKYQKPPWESKIRCYNCNKKGHLAANCRLPQRKRKNGGKPSECHSRALIATALAASAQDPNASWVVDTGATHHMTGDSSCLTAVHPSPIKSIVFGGGDAVRVLGQGDCHVESIVRGKCHVLTLKNVLLLDRLAYNLLSVAQMAAKGVTVCVKGNSCFVEDDGEVIVEAAKLDGLYKAILNPTALPTAAK
jgi:hypothetical protein